MHVMLSPLGGFGSWADRISGVTQPGGGKKEDANDRGEVAIARVWQNG
jgi:hypothetical protein